MAAVPVFLFLSRSLSLSQLFNWCTGAQHLYLCQWCCKVNIISGSEAHIHYSGIAYWGEHNKGTLYILGKSNNHNTPHTCHIRVFEGQGTDVCVHSGPASQFSTFMDHVLTQNLFIKNNWIRQKCFTSNTLPHSLSHNQSSEHYQWSPRFHSFASLSWQSRSLTVLVTAVEHHMGNSEINNQIIQITVVF